MFFAVDLDAEEVILHEPDVFTAFSIRVVNPPSAWAVSDHERLVKVVTAAGLGTGYGRDDVLIDPAAIIERAGSGHDEEWLAQFAAMCSYAESKGWVIDGQIQAHIEWPQL